MLHILWLILKFILIVLGILLGLLLLVFLLVLFCPVRYKASVVKTEGGLKQIEGEGIVSWLFRGVSLKAGWKDQQLNLAFHLFGIPVKRKTETMSESYEDQNEEKSSGQKEDTSKSIPPERDDPEINGLHADRQETEETEKNYGEISDKTSEQKLFFAKKIYNRLQSIFKNIHAKICGIKEKFCRMKKQVSWWKAFLEHPRVKAAGELVWKHAKFLLKHIFPTRIEGQVTFSFEDPALTGTALAVLGMTIPFHKNCVQINPRFDGENYLQGNIKARGRIYGFVFVRAALSIYFNKNIKYVIKRWKNRRA